MKLRVGWVVLLALVVADVAKGADLQFLERFALAKDRTEVLKELVPGTEDYYYFTCLHHQETGKLDEVPKLLEAWAARYGETAQVREIRNRQALLRYPSKSQETLDYLKSIFDLSFDHQRQVPGEAPGLPTVLDPALISRETLLKRTLASEEYGDTVNGFLPRAFDWLLATDLSPALLRNLLDQLSLPDYPRLPELIVKDLDAPNSGNFGELGIHKLLTREQLDALLALKPELLDNTQFIETYLRRLMPGNDDANWQRDPAAMGTYLERLWDFAQRLAPAHTSLKAHVLYHRLAFDMSQGIYDRERFLQYIKIPRQSDFIDPKYLDESGDQVPRADVNRDFDGATGLPPVGSDEDLIAFYLRAFFETDTDYDSFRPYIREDYLRRRFAAAKLTQGKGDLERWYAWLDPGDVDDLKNRVEVAFVPENKERFGVDEAVTLDVWVKNVDRLLVKVFEIDTRNYYQQFKQPINTAIDLDGLVANEEQVYTYAEPPLTRVRREFSFPELTGRGVWVLEFVGNGTSSRAVVAKGDLQYLSRTSSGGQVFTVFDETGTKVPDASIWFSERMYTADKDGEITLPFSTTPGEQTFLLCAGDFTTLANFQHAGENYNLTVGFHVDQESLRAGMTAKVAVRPLLYLNGTPIPLSRLKNPVLSIRSRTHDGIESSQQISDFALQNNELSVHEFRVPENLAEVTFALNGTLEKLTGGEPLPLSAEQSIAVNGINATPQTAALFLTRSDGSYGLEMRDKNGMAVADRLVNLTLNHLDFTDPVTVDLQTDREGRIALGNLQDIYQVNASSPGFMAQSWNFSLGGVTYPPVLQGSTREALYVPLSGDAPDKATDAASLLEMRQGVYTSDRSDALALEDGYLTLSGLSAGNYLLRMKPSGQQITVRVTDGEATGGYVASAHRILETPAPAVLQIQQVKADSSGLEVLVGGANEFTRVHVVSTRFLPDRYAYHQFNVTTPPQAEARSVNQGYALYTSGRQIGDEFRYVLERRFAEKFPGNMLERPSLLLNPWSFEETQAAQDEASAGDAKMALQASPSVAQERSGEEMENSLTNPQELFFSPSFDFLDGESSAIYNLKPDANGLVTLPAEALQGRGYVQIVATDPFATVSSYAALPAQAWTPRDQRLAKALDPAKSLVEQKRIQVLEAGAELKVSLTGEANVQVYDSVASVMALFITLNGDAKLAEFSFVSRWPSLSDEEKRTKFSTYESHELNLFLYHKDRPFFDAVVRPYLANKYQKTFIDQWLLEEDLKGYLEPWEFGQLNLAEKILLARRFPETQAVVSPFVRDALDMQPPNPERFNTLFMTALYGGALGSSAGFAVHDLVSTYNTANFYVDESGGFGGGGGGGFGIRSGAAGNGGFDPTVGVDINGDGSLNGLGIQNAPASPPAPGNTAEHNERLERQRREMEADLRKVEADSDKIRQYVEKSKELPEGADAKGIKQYVFRVPEIEEELAADEESVALEFDAYRALYRAPEKTKALVENDYYELPIGQATSGLIPVNAFWRDYAEADPAKPFVSGNLAEAASNFTEAMLALAVLDLPFESPKHEQGNADGFFTLKAGGAAIAFYKDIDAAPAVAETPVLVSQNFFRQDDRFRYEGNQQFDKFVTGEFLTGVVYGCQVTATNPASTPLQIEVLHQIPAGAVPVGSGRYTKSERLGLDAYSTARLEYFFYFPQAGAFTHFPVHVSQNGQLLAHAEPVSMAVVDVPTTADTTSWAYVSQQGTADEVIEYLKQSNLNRLDLGLVLWRMKDQAFYQQVLTLLKGRAIYQPELWAYALHHNDAEGLKTFLQYREDFVAQTGPSFENALLTIEPVERKTYQHMEFAPLLNPRAHHLEGKWMITNAQLELQYNALLNVLAHRAAPRQEDLLALTYYLLLQDRVGEAMTYFEQVQAEALPARIQYDYLQAYLAFYREEPEAAATIAAQYKDYPVDTWRERFAAVAAQASEIAGANAPATDKQPGQDALAAQEPQLDLEVKENTLLIHYGNLKSCVLSFYPIDLEMLFTRSPFALADTSVVAGVKPLATLTVTFDEAQSQIEVSLPAEFAARHVIVKAEAGGINRSGIRYASSLVAQLIERYGQVQVTAKADGKPLPKVYVKVFAQMQSGETVFYRDGYTDLRGRFDYASSSTLDIAQVSQFAILVISEEAGARVLTASPPAR